jgi:hypothetical protein
MSLAGLGPKNDCADEGQQQSERMLNKDYDRKGSVEKELLVVSLKGLVV